MSLQAKIRLVTAVALFDGHDAAINIMRRILQSQGAEIIHLGHNRSVLEIVEAAIEEDVQAIAITSYQGGHIEFFKYMKDLLRENGCDHIKIFGGGGGTILPHEIKELHDYGITRIYSPDDGRTMGLEGMISDLLSHCVSADAVTAFNNASSCWNGKKPLNESADIRRIARAVTLAENEEAFQMPALSEEATVSVIQASEPGQRMAETGLQLQGAAGQGMKLAVGPTEAIRPAPVLGITGTGGAGKSSVTDELVRRFLHTYTDKTIAVISVDPSKKKTGGALLGDRIRMNSISSPRAYMRSLATRDADKALSHCVQDAIDICRNAGYDFIILESAGVGQSDAAILDYCDLSLYVMTPEYGAPSQLEKINMLDYADFIVINKFDKAGALDALDDVRKQYKRSRQLWTASNDSLPVLGAIAAQFNDVGMNRLFAGIMQLVHTKSGVTFGSAVPDIPGETSVSSLIIPADKTRYLSDIASAIRDYDSWAAEQVKLASLWYKLNGTIEALPAKGDQVTEALMLLLAETKSQIHPQCLQLVENWPVLQEHYKQDALEYQVRGKLIRESLVSHSLSGTRIPKVILPAYNDWGDLLRWQLQENLPGRFPYTAGVFELKRTGEDPTRMFAGEGGPERTNKRFHYVSLEQPAKRLSTAFDSVTLYGEDPDERPDIYGKIGNAGVSVATVDDAKKLYSGFDLCDPKTSVSMTINGPAPVLLAFFLNAAIDQQCEKYITANEGWQRVNELVSQKFEGTQQPRYNGSSGKHETNVVSDGGVNENITGPPLPAGNNGLGLQLLGLSGDEVLPTEIYAQIRAEAVQNLRGTVQADILKEDQAQNTCIFSTEFALKLMGDVQEYFIDEKIKNFYSVSISGYHIAEAGANPITQLAFTLANGFTYIEYYLSRGMNIDDFAPNLSFFFSNGMDPEYSVIGRVARRIWAKAMKYKYKGNDRSQKLKYHIQTSGRSLHAQEIDFNDIRTTLQALYAIYDNCSSLHTNAYDEAITTPTEESVRRAMAIQLIINKELGSAKTENFTQGSFLIEELTDLVEKAVLQEFDRITQRGGVLGAMERMYQRNKIQEESLYYESLKHSGELPVVGVNTFLNKNGSPSMIPNEVIRSTDGEKQQQIANLLAFKARNASKATEALLRLQQAATSNKNVFAELMETVKYCSLGQITHALYQVGGQYRRNM
ncbi:methylmalonyl-CoA mutase family protein [Filimonas effusa]|uniref:Fused isobutyryl-CoA mutase n=1 Tax=Filimonas effusa TaxID=2508721 RepID=A0A4Q1D4M7_9BACT|nr:methylmalonyl-CoA mutase family protein [Filimonas effusa]RXK83432.1 methylmalonyl-CoA mutase [Filimonas effusa]